MKKISCIIPIYNVENYIEKCIMSIENQYTDDIEIIAVNDGTPDHSIDKIKSFPNVTIINKANGGLSSARNEGIKHANGEYIWFIDGDDYIEDGAIKKLIDVIDKNASDVILFNYYKELDDKKTSIIENINNYDKDRRLFINTSACTKLFKRDFWNKNKLQFHEGIIYEDLALIPYVMLLTDEIAHLDDCLYTYVTRNNSIMKTKKFSTKKDDKFVALDDLKKYLTEKNIYYDNKEQYIYLTIRHLLIVYSTEIVEYGKDIYVKRFDDVNKVLNELDSNWINNKYLIEQSFLKRTFVNLFRRRQYSLCKIIINVMKGTGKI